MKFEENFESAGGKYAAQAYWNALAKLRAAWKEVYGEDLPTVGNRAMDSYEQAIDTMKARLASDAAGDKKLRDLLDVDVKDDIAEVLLGWADMDDVPPRAVKQAMREECARLGRGRYELRDLLRPVLTKAFAGANTRRPPRRTEPALAAAAAVSARARGRDRLAACGPWRLPDERGRPRARRARAQRSRRAGDQD